MTDEKPVRRRVTVPHDPVSMTKQAPRDGTSVEDQLRRYQNAGMVPAMGRQPRYGDFTGIGDFHEEMNRVREAERDFMLLPAAVRKVADNDVGLFLEMLYGGKPEMLKALEDAGLVKAQLPEQIVKVRVVPSEDDESSGLGDAKREEKASPAS